MTGLGESRTCFPISLVGARRAGPLLDRLDSDCVGLHPDLFIGRRLTGAMLLVTSQENLPALNYLTEADRNMQ